MSQYPSIYAAMPICVVHLHDYYNIRIAYKNNEIFQRRNDIHTGSSVTVISIKHGHCASREGSISYYGIIIRMGHNIL